MLSFVGLKKNWRRLTKLPNLLKELESPIIRERILERIQVCHEALQLIDRYEDPETWATVHAALGLAYTQSEIGSIADNIEDGISCIKIALEVLSPIFYPKRWATTERNLGEAYLVRIYGNSADNIEQAIFHNKNASEVYLRERFLTEWSLTEESLGNIYFSRIYGDQAENIERAIQHYSSSIEVARSDNRPQDYANVLESIGTTYLRRIRGNRGENTEIAINFLSQALQVANEYGISQETTIRSTIALAEAYRERTGNDISENIEASIAACEQVLSQINRQTMPIHWIRAMTILGESYIIRQSEQKNNNLESAIDILSQAARIAIDHKLLPQHAKLMESLGDAYWVQSPVTPQNIEASIQFYKKALEWFKLDANPFQYSQLQYKLGNIYFTQNKWSEAIALYESAFEAFEKIYYAGATPISRQASLSQLPELSPRLAYCHAKLGQFPEAIETLERGKTRLLRERMMLDQAILDRVSSSDKNAFLKIREQIALLEAEAYLSDHPGNRDFITISTELNKERQNLALIVTKIRLYEPDFMLTGLKFQEIASLIPLNGFLVIPLLTMLGSIVFILPYGITSINYTHVIWLDHFDTTRFNALLIGNDENPGWLRAYFDRKSHVAHWFDCVELLTQHLWELLMGAIHTKILELRDIAESNLSNSLSNNSIPLVLIPQGNLGLVPLHAAWHDVNGIPHYFLDYYTIRYAPSAYILKISHNRIDQLDIQNNSILAVVNPTSDLDYSLLEGRSVIDFFQPDHTKILTENTATHSAIIEHSATYNYLHFACHGIYDWQDPMQSGLILASDDGVKIFSLSQIVAQLNLDNSRLVVLSACETGLVEFEKVPDEFIGLAAGFLQVGTAGVLSTLWAIEDHASYLLIERFYYFHLRESYTPAEALRAAQIWLRNASRTDLGNYYKSFMRLPLDIATQGFFDNFKHGPPSEKPFAHPLFWSAFVFAGV